MPLPLIYIFHPYIRYIYNYYIVHISACNISSASSPLTLTDDDPVRSHPKRCPDQITDRDLPVFLLHLHSLLPATPDCGHPCDLQFRAVLNCDNTFFFRNKIRQCIQKGCFSGSCPSADKNVIPCLYGLDPAMLPLLLR